MKHSKNVEVLKHFMFYEMYASEMHTFKKIKIIVSQHKHALALSASESVAVTLIAELMIFTSINIQRTSR